MLHNPRPISANNAPKFEKPLRCVNVKIFYSSKNRLHLVRTGDEMQKPKYLLIRVLSQIEDIVPKCKTGNESKNGARTRQNLIAADITWSKEKGPFLFLALLFLVISLPFLFKC